MSESEAKSMNDAMAHDEMINKQREAIEKEIQASHKLVGDNEDIKVLEQQFSNDPTFLKNAIQLQSKYSSLRRTRPDGNCMYRAMAFGQFQRMLNDETEAKRFRKSMEEAKEDMVKLGFPVFTMEDFYDNFVDQIDELGKGSEDDGGDKQKKYVYNIKNRNYNFFPLLHIQVTGQVEQPSVVFK